MSVFLGPKHCKFRLENTLPALQSALDLGARFLEIDVHLSSDGVPVVIHDAELARTTGMNGSVFDRPVAELVNIEAAERQRFGAQYAGTCIPTLADAAALLEERPEITLFVEVKRASLARFGHDQVVPKVLEAVRPWRSQVVIISFDLPAIFRARQVGGFRIGWVLPQYDSTPASSARPCNPSSCSATRRRSSLRLVGTN